MKTPIVLAAFGTTTRALDTYTYIDKQVREQFPGHEIVWAYSSRMVLDAVHQNGKTAIRHPHQVLNSMAGQGTQWAVVQSMHLMCGHEFYRLVDEAHGSHVRVSMGLPLLTSHEDYFSVADSLEGVISTESGEATVLVGHGTDHPAWATYKAFEAILRERYDSSLFMGVVEGFPEADEIVERVKAAGFKKVKLVPFMLVAGVHFIEDLDGDEDSWRVAFEEAGISVQLEKNGVGYNQGIILRFCDHIREALEMVAVNSGE